jgi:hypothetical protein
MALSAGAKIPADIFLSARCRSADFLSHKGMIAV